MKLKDLNEEIKSTVMSALNCSYIDSEILDRCIGPNSYVKTLYAKFGAESGIRITISLSEDSRVEILFISEKGNFTLSDYFEKYHIVLGAEKSPMKQLEQYLNFIESNKLLSAVIDGKEWPSIPSTFGGMK